jgi:hypothetical protein
MTELACFNLFINAICLTVITSVLGLGLYLNELNLTFIFICTNLYFLIRGNATFYGEKGWRLILKSVVIIIFLKIALEIYRAILFYVTMWLL